MLKKILVIGLSSLLVLVVLISSQFASNDGNTSSSNLATMPEPPEPDADSPADTIKTLSATVTSLAQDMDTLRYENESLLREREEFETRIAIFESRILNQLSDELTQQQYIEQQVLDRLEQLSARLDRVSYDSWDPVGQPLSSSEIGHPYQQRKWQWIAPLEAGQESLDSTTQEPSLKPVLTIPQNATLVGSKTLTALIGRIPIENRIVDPIPFKVITGVHNLAANGQTIDGLKGSVWSGHAIGDWTLSCVTGSLTSVTFVFDDGRIESHGENTPGSRTIGWLSDDYGTPCIPGERKTNMHSYLAGQIAAGLMAGAADVAAAQATTLTQNALGTVQQSIVGDLDELLLGQSLSAGTSSLSVWLEKRADQEFDAVWVPTNQKVAIHVDTPIHIDYDKTGRKLAYEIPSPPWIATDLH